MSPRSARSDEWIAGTDVRTLRVRADDGVSLAVAEWSEKGVPCLLLHGLGASAAHWCEIAREMRVHFRVLAPDWRGHGDSDWDPSGRYSARRYVEDLVQIVDSLCRTRVILVGHSMGAALAMQFAARYPERMAGLVLAETGAELEARGLARLRADTGNLPRTYVTPEAYARRLEALYPLVSPVRLRRLAHDDLRRSDRGGWEPKADPAVSGLFETLRPAGAARQGIRAEESARTIRCPTLVVRGAASSIVSSSAARRLHDAIPLARFAEVPRAGHAVILDRPAALVGVLFTFLLGDPPVAP